MITDLRDWVAWRTGYACSRAMNDHSFVARSRYRVWNAINRCLNGEDW